MFIMKIQWHAECLAYVNYIWIGFILFLFSVLNICGVYIYSICCLWALNFVHVMYNTHICKGHKNGLHFVLLLCNEHMWYVSIDAVSVYFSFAFSLLHVYLHTTFYSRACKWRKLHTAVLHGDLSAARFGFLVPKSNKRCRCESERLSERKLWKTKIYITWRNERFGGSRFVCMHFYSISGVPVVTSCRFSWLLFLLDVIAVWATFLFRIEYILGCNPGWQVIVIPNMQIVYL